MTKEFLEHHPFNNKVMRRQLHQNFQRFYSCIPMENEGRCLMVSNMGRPKDEEIQEFFVGLESQFEGIVSAKQVLTKREGDSERGRLQGVLLTFQSEAALAKFTEQEELKYKGLLLKWTLMTEVLKVGFFITITCPMPTCVWNDCLSRLLRIWRSEARR